MKSKSYFFYSVIVLLSSVMQENYIMAATAEPVENPSDANTFSFKKGKSSWMPYGTEKKIWAGALLASGIAGVVLTNKQIAAAKKELAALQEEAATSNGDDTVARVKAKKTSLRRIMTKHRWLKALSALAITAGGVMGWYSLKFEKNLKTPLKQYPLALRYDLWKEQYVFDKFSKLIKEGTETVPEGAFSPVQLSADGAAIINKVLLLLSRHSKEYKENFIVRNKMMLSASFARPMWYVDANGLYKKDVACDRFWLSRLAWPFTATPAAPCSTFLKEDEPRYDEPRYDDASEVEQKFGLPKKYYEALETICGVSQDEIRKESPKAFVSLFNPWKRFAEMREVQKSCDVSEQEKRQKSEPPIDLDF